MRAGRTVSGMKGIHWGVSMLTVNEQVQQPQSKKSKATEDSDSRSELSLQCWLRVRETYNKRWRREMKNTRYGLGISRD